MKKIILCLLLLFGSIKGFSQKQYYESIEPGDIVEPLLYLDDSNRSIMRHNFEDVTQEIDYISNGISNVSVVYLQHTVYISWNVCDDSTQSIFFITKSDDSLQCDTIGFVRNVPCYPHLPLLYSLKESNVNLNKNYFYKLYKMEENGEVNHIITLILTKRKETEQL